MQTAPWEDQRLGFRVLITQSSGVEKFSVSMNVTQSHSVLQFCSRRERLLSSLHLLPLTSSRVHISCRKFCWFLLLLKSHSGLRVFAAWLLFWSSFQVGLTPLRERDHQLLQLYPGKEMPSQSGQIQGLPEVILNSLPWCVRSFLKNEMLGLWRKLLQKPMSKGKGKLLMKTETH